MQANSVGLHWSMFVNECVCMRFLSYEGIAAGNCNADASPAGAVPPPPSACCSSVQTTPSVCFQDILNYTLVHRQNWH